MTAGSADSAQRSSPVPADAFLSAIPARRGMTQAEEKFPARNGKGCDIGYVPAADSGEGARQRGNMHHRSP